MKTNKQGNKIKKGCLVQLNNDVCFTRAQGGSLQSPLTNHVNDESGIVEAHRPTSADETRRWYESAASKGMTAGGDSKLPPQSTMVTLRKGYVYQVLRARCRVRLGWGNAIPGMLQLLDTETGEAAYIQRELVEVV